jgi:hypothetical protein
MATKKKANSGNPAKLALKADADPLAKRLFNRIKEGTLIVQALQNHITPMGDSKITLEQWRYLRGSVVADLAIYAQLTGQPSPIDIIVQAEQERVLVEQESPDQIVNSGAGLSAKRLIADSVR